MFDITTEQEALSVITQAMLDHPLSTLSIKPEIRKTPGVITQAGWRVTYEHVKTGAMVEWELFSTGKTPALALIQFAKDLQHNLALPSECNTCGNPPWSYSHYTECLAGS